MTPHELQGKRILVVGAGLTGLSVVRHLHRHALPFSLAEQRELDESTRDLLQGAPVLQRFDADAFADFDVLILSPGIPRAQPALAAAIAAGALVIGDIELFAGVVEQSVIAVTGSNGKSTVVAWLTHVLQASGVRALACGNIGLPALDALEQGRAAGTELYVLELSSYQLESTRDLAPESAVVLNVSDDHMDRYDSLEHYAATKRRIYRGAALCVANREDQRTWPIDAAAGQATIWFSLERGAAVALSPVEIDGQTWLQAGDEPLLARSALHMPGEHNLANALAILALLGSRDLDRDTMLAALADYRGLPHRTELVAIHEAVRWYNDSKGTNVDACAKAIAAMPGPVILIAGGQGKGADFTALRPVTERAVKALLLLGEDRQLLAEALAGCAPIELVDSLDAAVTRAAALAAPGDVVLLSPACASFDMFRNFADRGDRFRQVVMELAA